MSPFLLMALKRVMLRGVFPVLLLASTPTPWALDLDIRGAVEAKIKGDITSAMVLTDAERRPGP